MLLERYTSKVGLETALLHGCWHWKTRMKREKLITACMVTASLFKMSLKGSDACTFVRSR